MQATLLNKLSTGRRAFYFLFFLIFILTHLRQNAHSNYDCEICSDKAGYYMYLPAITDYGFEVSSYPEHFDQEHGSGFWFDTNNNRVVTKFTCGVALMQAPFYLIGATFNSIFSLGNDPYSRYFLLFINIGLAFYCTVGLYCLKRWLEHFVSKETAFIVALVTFFGTHLYYYVVDESLMSHAYSFTLLCIMLLYTKRWSTSLQFKDYLVATIAVAIATLIRPTNILFALIFLLIDINGSADLKTRLKLIFTLRNILAALVVFVLVFLPQMLYWKFAYGSYFVWSYTGEGFTNWNDPWFLTVWFSPQSGLFPYAPILLLSILAAVRGIFSRVANSVLVIGVFFVVSYLCAAWINPFFGTCNFGKRPMVEFLPLLMLPLAHLYERAKQKSVLQKRIVQTAFVVFVAYNIWMVGAFDTCFGGETWEWSRFAVLLKTGTFLP